MSGLPVISGRAAIAALERIGYQVVRQRGATSGTVSGAYNNDTMIPAVRESLSELERLCHKHHVHRLFLVGSARTDQFDPTRSDVDFFVEFEPGVRRGFDGAYFGLLSDLRSLLHMQVDLIERQCVEKPYVLASLERSKVPLYAVA